jgi:hypothetical protein
MEALQGRKTSEGSEVDNQSRWYHSEVIHQVGWWIDMSGTVISGNSSRTGDLVAGNWIVRWCECIGWEQCVFWGIQDGWNGGRSVHQQSINIVTRIQEWKYYAPSGGIWREERMGTSTLGKTLYTNQ